jgi:hypothetical protein
MSNLGAVMSNPGSSPPAARERRPLARLARNWDILAVVALIVASLPLAWISPQTRIVIAHPGTFDDHWVLDGVYKAAHGTYWARDVVFLYGPLAHWMLAAPPRLAGGSLGSIYTSYRVLLLWCAIAFTWGGLRLLLPEQPAWKRFLLTLLLSVFWTSWDGRTALGLLLFAAFVRGWYAVHEGRVKAIPFACASALAIIVGFWYSADTGTYGLAAWLLAMACTAWEYRREAKPGLLVSALAVFSVSMIVLVLLTNLLTGGSPLDFHFWRTSLALVSVHRWNEPAAMSYERGLHLVLPLLIAIPVFLVRLMVRDDTRPAVSRIGFLLSAFAFAVLSMQSGLVRSDYSHIIPGVYPLVFFTAVIVFSFRSKVALLAAFAAVAASLLAGTIIPEFQPASMKFRLARAFYPLPSCPAGYRDVDRACFPETFANFVDTATTYLKQHSNAGDAALPFPYQYMFAVAADRKVSGDVEQSFLAAGPYLSQVDIHGMQRANAPVGMFFRDGTAREYVSGGVLSLPIDEVSNFTRTPDVWFWVLRNYRADQPLAPGVVGLLRDGTRDSRLTMAPYPLSLPARTYTLDQPTTAIGLGAPAWPSTGADFLRLRLKVAYGPLWKLRKPERLQLEITRADGSRTLRAFVVEPNVSSEIWIYPWDEADLMRYFDNDESAWRNGARPAITNLRLLVSPFDWFSQPARSVTVEGGDAVRVGLQN